MPSWKCGMRKLSFNLHKGKDIHLFKFGWFMPARLSIQKRFVLHWNGCCLQPWRRARLSRPVSDFAGMQNVGASRFITAPLRVDARSKTDDWRQPKASRRIYHLTKLSREVPDSPCTTFFEEAEWKALYAFTRKAPPKDEPTLRQVTRMVASLGGFLGRKGDGDPGTMTL